MAEITCRQRKRGHLRFPYVFRLLMEIRKEKAVKRNPVECIVMKAKG